MRNNDLSDLSSLPLRSHPALVAFGSRQRLALPPVTSTIQYCFPEEIKKNRGNRSKSFET